jgi:hypothetical protein
MHSNGGTWSGLFSITISLTMTDGLLCELKDSLGTCDLEGAVIPPIPLEQ